MIFLWNLCYSSLQYAFLNKERDKFQYDISNKIWNFTFASMLSVFMLVEYDIVKIAIPSAVFHGCYNVTLPYSFLTPWQWIFHKETEQIYFFNQMSVII